MEKTIVGGRYAIERLAGAGGMARVYRAVDTTSGTPVAIKLLHERATHVADRFEREADVLSTLAHPSIVRHVAHGTMPSGELWLAMEWLEGTTLAERLRSGGVTAREAISICRQVANGLGAAHALGVVHRDIKPSNIFLPEGASDGVKVLDFGVAHVARRDTDLHTTRTGVMLGTPGYMAPEQARGQRGVDARADVFSLGCVLFECLTGKPPFVAETFMAVLAKILLEQVPQLAELRPDLPPEVSNLTMRLLAKEPEPRPADGRAVAKLLEDLGSIDGDKPKRVREQQTAAITDGERRFLSVVLVAKDAPAELVVGPHGTAVMAPDGNAISTIAGLRALSAKYGGELERLLDGALVVTFYSRGSATDQAMRAARCALSLRDEIGSVPIALATGRGTVAGRFPVGEVIDRAARLLRTSKRRKRAPTGASLVADTEVSPDAPTFSSASQVVRVDETTAGLLDARFEVGGDDLGLALAREIELEDTARTLLGRAIPCVGRERELGTLEGTFDESKNEPIARVVLVTAPPGIGKSRLRAEIVRRLRARTDPRVEIWIARGDALRAGSPFGMIGQAIRGAAGIKGGEHIELRRVKLRGRVARNVAPREVDRVTQFLGEAAGVDFPEGASLQLGAARQDPQLMNDQIRRAFEDFVSAECAAQPTVLVLEDLHWGDVPTVQLVDAALRQARELPLLVIAFARPEVHDVFPKLWETRDLQPILLRELKRSSCEKLAREALGPDADAKIIADVVERSGGNAFYLEELVRAVADGRGGRLPETVMAMVEARLDALESEARRILRAASVFGQAFWSGGVAALLGGGDRSMAIVGEWFDELERREIVHVRRGSRFPREHEYAFRNALVRDTAYAMLTPDDCALGHRLAGEWLAAVGENDAVALAEHFERGGDRDKAAGAWKDAAEQALAGADLDAAVERATHGIALGATGGGLGALELVLAEAHSWRAHHLEAQMHAKETMALVPVESAAWFRAAGLVSQTAGKLGQTDRILGIAATIAEARTDDATRADFAKAASRAVAALIMCGEADQTADLIARLGELEAVAKKDDPATMAWIDSALSWRAMTESDTGACLYYDTLASEAFEAAGDLRHACEHRAAVAYDHSTLGAWSEAERAFLEARDAALRIGLTAVATMATHNLGYIQALRGAFAEAFASEEDACRSYEDQGDTRMLGASLIYLALIHQFAGDHDAAVVLGERAVDTLAASRPLRIHALGVLARVRLVRGDVGDALRAAREAMELREGRAAIGEGEALVDLAYAETLDASGDREGARRAIARGRAMLLDRASKIRDDALRASFLERVPEHARILELARAWEAPSDTLV